MDQKDPDAIRPHRFERHFHAPSVIVAGARTPIGRFLGSLKGSSAAELGGIAISAALGKAAIEPEQVQHVIMGHVLNAAAAAKAKP